MGKKGKRGGGGGGGGGGGDAAGGSGGQQQRPPQQQQQQQQRQPPQQQQGQPPQQQQQQQQQRQPPQQQQQQRQPPQQQQGQPPQQQQRQPPQQQQGQPPQQQQQQQQQQQRQPLQQQQQRPQDDYPQQGGGKQKKGKRDKKSQQERQDYPSLGKQEGPPQQHQGPPQQYAGLPQQYAGLPQQYAGPPQQYAGLPQQYASQPQQYQGQPQQQYRQPPPQQMQQQQYQQQPRGMGRGARMPGLVQGQRPQEASFFRAPVPQQGPPPRQWRPQGQQDPPMQMAPSGPPVAQPAGPWVRGPSPPHQQTPSRETTPTQAQPPSRELTPTQQQRAPPPQQAPLPTQQPRQEISAGEQPPARQQPPPQRKPPGSGGNGISDKMKGMSLGPIPKRADRPQDPKRGRNIVVETNHLALNIKNKDMVIHHYDVSVNPEKPYRVYRKALQLIREKCYPRRYPAFDGKKNLYSYPELPFKTSELVETVTVYDNERDQMKEVTVTIKHAATVNVSVIWDYLNCGSSTNAPQDAIQALDIVLRQPAANRFVTVGRSFFTPPAGRVISLGDGLDLWYGFFQSAIIGWKPFLNIDVAHKGFPTPDHCIPALAKILRKEEQEILDPRFKMKLYEEEQWIGYIKGLKINYEIPQRSVKRTYKVNGISLCPRDNKFDVVNKETKASTKTTVELYFQSQYKYALRHPHLPCISVGPNDKPLALPMELCRIHEGQITMRKMNDIQTRNMVREAAVDTDRRKNKIMGSIHQINFNRDPCLNEFGLSVADNFTKVRARILNAPTVDYKDNKPVTVRAGVWRNLRFLQGAELSSWRILNSNRYIRDPDLRNLGEGLVTNGQACGMRISNNYQVVTKENPNDIERYFKQCQQEEVKLVIVVLPDRGVTYASVKKMAELQVGILTQCLKSATVKTRLSAATFVNILQKVNAKLNGINHNITSSFWPRFFQRPVIVVGADVTHPAPDQINVPSIAAVAASHDPNAFKYNMIWKLQPPREEVIRDLKEIMREQLMVFYRATKYKPEHILFYRDGVSEGQFKTILDRELSAIRQACGSLSADYKPPITFIVVQKRHHTRFFPEPKDADGRNKNVPAGTVVDTDITHPTELDFYLVSHASIQGTARPTKYHLLWDDSNMSEQDLEEITYYLCHLFTRCTRSVSYPAPTYYAHLAAFRARSYTDTDRLRLDQLDMEQERRKVKDVFLKSNPMYFV